MPSLLRYHELDLPVFDGERPLIKASAAEVERAILANQTTILRHCHFYFWGKGLGLSQILGLVEVEFDRLQDDAGLRIASHKWGLYPIKTVKEQNPDLLIEIAKDIEDAGGYGGQDILPPGMLIAADVAIIQPINPVPRQESERVVDCINSYHSDPPHALYATEIRYRIDDLSDEQTVFGLEMLACRELVDTSPTSYLVDIEPKLIH